MKHSSQRPTHLTAAIFILSGLVLLLIGIIWKASAKEFPYYQDLAIEILVHFGIGALVVGVLGIIIDLRHYQEYFKQRLAEIVIDKKYMQNLSSEELIQLQTEVLKAFFRNDNIGGEDGFLRYYQKNIQGIIVMPYRTHLQSDLKVDFVDGDENSIIVKEIISWTCRSNQNSIQKEIRYREDGNFTDLNKISVTLKHDSFETDDKCISFPYKDFDKTWKTEDGKGFNFPLEKYNFDGLKIIIKVEYVIATQKFYSWTMTQPSRGVALTIRYPSKLSVNRELFGIDKDVYESNDPGSGYYKMETDKWLMPEEGLVFQFIPALVK